MESRLSLRRIDGFNVLLLITLIILIASLSMGCGGVEVTDSGGGSGNTNTGSVILSWQAPTTNEDGTPLSDLEGFRVYHGEYPDNYTNIVDVGSNTTVSIGNLPLGKTIYLAVTAVDTSGNESRFSMEIYVVAT